MSYGYYRVGSSADPELARQRYARLLGNAAAMLQPAAAAPPPASEPVESPRLVDTLLDGEPGAPAPAPRHLRDMARLQGFTGNTCNNCGSTRMKVSGHCEVCEECGTTTGCS